MLAKGDVIRLGAFTFNRTNIKLFRANKKISWVLEEHGIEWNFEFEHRTNATWTSDKSSRS